MVEEQSGNFSWLHTSMITALSGVNYPFHFFTTNIIIFNTSGFAVFREMVSKDASFFGREYVLWNDVVTAGSFRKSR